MFGLMNTYAQTPHSNPNSNLRNTVIQIGTQLEGKVNENNLQNRDLALLHLLRFLWRSYKMYTNK